MSLKDFSFKQLDKSAKISVGATKTTDKEKVPVARRNCVARHCTAWAR